MTGAAPQPVTADPDLNDDAATQQSLTARTETAPPESTAHASGLRESLVELGVTAAQRLRPVLGIAADAASAVLGGAATAATDALRVAGEHLSQTVHPAESEPDCTRGDIWGPASRERTLGRLHEDMERRSDLGPRQRSALDGIVHALRRNSMDPAYAERLLLAYDLGSATRAPTAVVAVGPPEQASHMTWQVSGMGIFVHTAMWGTVREAAQLQHAQREAGVERACVISWLGYAPPGPWGALSGGAALRGGASLARHLRGWFAAVEAGQMPRAHTAVEAHSYGTLVAARGLQILQRGTPPHQVDALVVSGPVGLPTDLAEHPEAMGLPPEKVYFALAETDWLSALGFRLSGRRPWKKVTRLPVLPEESLHLAGVVGHNTSRHRPGARFLHRGHGYRDPGTASLYRIARATTGRPF